MMKMMYQKHVSVRFNSVQDRVRVYIFLVDFEPLSLQAICRSVIRTILRNNIDIEHPDIKKKVHNAPKRPKKKRALRRLVVPIFEESDMETSDNFTDDDDRRDAGRVRLNQEINGGREFNTILDLVLGSLSSCRNDRNRETENRDSEHETSETNEPQNNDNENKTQENKPTKSETNDSEVRNVDSCDNETKSIKDEIKIETNGVKNVVSNNACSSNTENLPNATRKQNKREKFDSGLGDDLLNDKWSSDSENTNNMDVDTDSDDNSSEKATYKGKMSHIFI